MNKKKTYSLTCSPFYRISSIHVLARLLAVPANSLVEGSSLYSKYYFGKSTNKKGKIRDTETPYGKLRFVHERILKLLSRVETPSYLHSGIKGKSYITNAQQHIGCKQTYTLDIQGFFPATKNYHVYQFFRDDLDCSEDIAGIFANLICVDGHLATGSPLSTLMSFFIHKNAFDKLAQLAARNNITMTLYVDDLSFSGDYISYLLKVEIGRIINSQGLSFHKEKLYKKSVGREITGVIAGQSSILLPRRRHLAIHEMRNTLRYAQASLEKESAYRKLLSRLSEASQIQPEFKKLKLALQRAKARILQ